MRGRGAGGKKWDQVPMCPKCHSNYEVSKTIMNRRFKLPALAKFLWAYYEEDIKK